MKKSEIFYERIVYNMESELTRMNFIISTNDNPTYLEFLSPVCEYYNALNHNVSVAYLSNNTPPKVNCHYITQIKPVEGYDPGIQAKLARSYLACNLDDGVVYTLLDIDQIIIDLRWLNAIIEKNKPAIVSGESDLMCVGANVYHNTSETGKFPMYFTTGQPAGFRKLFGINKSNSLQSLLEKYAHIDDPIDNKEKTINSFGGFSDESLFRYCITKHNLNTIHEDTPDAKNMHLKRRIDRCDWVMESCKNPCYGKGFWKQTQLTDDQKKLLLSGFFIDSFPARPYGKHKSIIDDIIKTALMHNN